MDLTPYIAWIVFAHVLGAFLFAAGHGVSLFVAFQVRRERDRGRIGALLDASSAALAAAYVGLLVLLIAGILAGIVLQSFGRWWIWVSLVALIAIAVAMTPLGIAYFNSIRMAIGQRTRDLKDTDPDPVPVSDAELASILASRRPEQLLAIGGGGFLVILYLMMFKPF
jgi:MFS family permease